MRLIYNPAFNEYKKRCLKDNVKPSITGFATWNACHNNGLKRWHPEENNNVAVVTNG